MLKQTEAESEYFPVLRLPANLSQSLTRYSEALTLATNLAMLPLVAHSHLGLGKLYRRPGQLAQARAHLTPRRRCTPTDMRSWLVAGNGGTGGARVTGGCRAAWSL